jgi:hypothetical protein
MTTTPNDPTTALPGRPRVVDLATWQTARDELLVREKAHTREGDDLAAARRQLPMVEFGEQRQLAGGDVRGAAIRHRGSPAAATPPGSRHRRRSADAAVARASATGT